MKSVEVLFCRPTYHPFPIFAWGIMLFQGFLPWGKQAASHTVLRYSTPSGWRCVHITGDGVHWESEDSFLSRYEVVKIYEVGGEFPLMKVRNWVNNRLSFTYDTKQIWGFVIQFLGITKHNMFGSDLEKYVCSEFVADFMSEFLGWDLGDSDHWDLNKLEDALVGEEKSRRIA